MGENQKEEEIERLRQQLEETLKKKGDGDGRIAELNLALKSSMEQGMKSQAGSKKTEEKLMEAHRKLARVSSENDYLSKALVVKEKFIENLDNIKTRKEAECVALMERLELIEKDNSLLKYELRGVEKKLWIKTEETEFLQRQDADNGRRIKKLEADCRALRVLARKNGIEVERRSHFEKKQMVGSFTREPHLAFLCDVVHNLENENMILKEILAKKVETSSVASDQRSSLFSEKNDGPKTKHDLDFDEREKLAIVAYDQHSGSVSEKNNGPKTHHDDRTSRDSEMRLMDDFLEMEKLAIIAVKEGENHQNTELVSVTGNSDEWLKFIRNLIIEQQRVSKRSIEELLEDVRTVLGGVICPKAPSVSSPNIVSSSAQNDNLSISIGKIMELVGALDLESHEDPVEFLDIRIHVLAWERKESAPIFGGFLRSSEDLLKKAITFEKFTSDVASLFEWFFKKCSPHQSDSTVRDEFERHLGGSSPGTAMGLEIVQKLMHKMEKMHSASQAQIKGLKEQLDLIKDEDSKVSRQDEPETSEESKRIDDEGIENKDLETHIAESKPNMEEVLQKLSSVEVELDHKRDRCRELEQAYFELQQQHQSIIKNQDSEKKDNEKELLKTGMEINKASAKLAECEETILKLEKHLKALASARELSIVDKVVSFSETNLKILTQHPSLRDHLISEENHLG